MHRRTDRLEPSSLKHRINEVEIAEQHIHANLLHHQEVFKAATQFGTVNLVSVSKVDNPHVKHHRFIKTLRFEKDLDPNTVAKQIATEMAEIAMIQQGNHKEIKAFAEQGRLAKLIHSIEKIKDFSLTFDLSHCVLGVYSHAMRAIAHYWPKPNEDMDFRITAVINPPYFPLEANTLYDTLKKCGKGLSVELSDPDHQHHEAVVTLINLFRNDPKCLSQFKRSRSDINTQPQSFCHQIELALKLQEDGLFGYLSKEEFNSLKKLNAVDTSERTSSAHILLALEEGNVENIKPVLPSIASVDEIKEDLNAKKPNSSSHVPNYARPTHSTRYREWAITEKRVLKNSIKIQEQGIKSHLQIK